MSTAKDRNKKTADQLLSDKLWLLSNMVEQTSEGLGVVNLEGIFLFVNPSSARMHGYTPEELIGKHISIFHAPDQIDAVKACLQVVQETGEFSGELWHVRRDGSVFPSLMHNSMLRDGAGNPIAMIGTMVDITERKKVIEALRESEELYRALVETSQDMVWKCDAEGRYTFLNQAWETTLGYSVDEMLGKHYSDFQTPEAAARDSAKHRQGLMTGASVRDESTILAKTGETVHIVFKASFLKDSEGNVIGSQGTASDITEKKRAETALIASEHRYRSLYDSMNEGVCLAEIIYHQGKPVDYRILDSNRTCEEITGLKREDVVRQLASELTGESPPPFLEIFGPVARSGKPVSFEADFARIDKTLSMSAFSPEIGKVAVIFEDVTERKKTEISLRTATEELRAEREALTEKNIALAQILDHIEKERQGFKQKICEDISRIVHPLLERLKTGANPDQEAEINATESGVQSLLNQDTDVMQSRFGRLTSREVEVCDLIRKGLSSKEISRSLSLSVLTVHKHREQIREKLGLTNQSVNLSSFLRTH